MAADTADILLDVGLNITKASQSAKNLKNVLGNTFSAAQNKAVKQLEAIGKIQDELDKLYAKQDKGIISPAELQNVEQLEYGFEKALDVFARFLGELNSVEVTPFQPLVDDIARVDTLMDGLSEKSHDIIANIAHNSLDIAIPYEDLTKENDALEDNEKLKQTNQNATNELTTANDRKTKAINSETVATQKEGNAVRGLTTLFGNLAKAIGKTTVKLLKFGASAAKSVGGFLVKHLKRTNKEITKTTAGLGNATNLLKKFIMAGIGVRSVYFLFRKFWAMVKEGVNIMAQVDDSTNAALSSITTATYTLKKQLGAAFANLIQVVAPALIQIINLLVKAAQAATQFFSALTGKSVWKKATEEQQDYRKSLDGSSKSTKKAADENKKYLSGLDEIARWEDPKGSEDFSGAFDDVAIEDKFNDLADKFKEIIDKLLSPFKRAWEIAGDEVIEAWKNALFSVKEMLKGIGRDFLEVWNQPATVAMLTNILRIIAGIGDVVKNLATNFAYAWDKAEVGKRILEDIRDIFSLIISHIKNMVDATVTWSAKLNFTPLLEAFERFLSSLRPAIDGIMGVIEDFYTTVLLPLSKWTIENGLPKLLDIFTAFNDKIDWKALRAGFKGFFEVLEPLLEAKFDRILNFMSSLADTIGDLVNAISKGDWDGALNSIDILGQKVNNFLNNIFKDKKLSDTLGTALAGIVEGAFKFAGNMGESLMSALLWIPDIIVKAVNKLSPTGVGEAIAKFINSAVARLGEWFKESDFMKFGETLGSNLSAAIQKLDINKIGEALKNIVHGIINLLVGFFSKVDYAGISSAFVQLVFQAVRVLISPQTLAGLGTILLQCVRSMVEMFIGFIQGCVQSLADAFKALGLDSVAGLLQGIADSLGGIVEWLRTHVFDPIVNGFKSLFGIHSPSTVFAELGTFIVEGLLNGIKSIISKVQEIWTNLKTFITTTFTNIKTSINSIMDAIKSMWNNSWNAVKTTITNIWNGIKTSITTVINAVKSGITTALNSIKSVWTNTWNALKTTAVSIFNSIWSGIKGVINSILGGVERMANGIISGLNKMISAMNSLSFDVPDWVPGIGGGHFGFNISYLNSISIPRLAQGAVIPANRPFLSQLGDQKNGKNLEAPESLLRQIVREESGGSNGGGSYRFTAQIGRRILFDEVITEAKLRQSASGKNPFELA